MCFKRLILPTLLAGTFIVSAIAGIDAARSISSSVLPNYANATPNAFIITRISTPLGSVHVFDTPTDQKSNTMAPQTHIVKSDDGKTITRTTIGEQNGIHYKIVESQSSDPQIIKQNTQQVSHLIAEQEHMAAQIQNQMRVFSKLLMGPGPVILTPQQRAENQQAEQHYEHEHEHEHQYEYEYGHQHESPIKKSETPASSTDNHPAAPTQHTPRQLSAPQS